MRKLQTIGVTWKMEVSYHKPVLSDNPLLTVKAKILRVARSVAEIESSLFDAQGELCTSAACRYYIYSKERAQQERGFNGCRVEGEP